MSDSTRGVDLLAAYRPLARVPGHRGTASFNLAGETFSGVAEFLLPAGGQAVIVFKAPADLISQDFGRDLLIEGIADGAPFRLECAEIYVRKATGSEHGTAWSLISPVNGPARVTYGGEGIARRVLALLDNFDFTCGDAVKVGAGWTRINTPLRVDGNGREVTFRQRADRPQLLPLVSAGLLHSTSLTEITCDAQDGESEDVLMTFAADVGALCTFAAGTGVSVGMLDIMDREGTLARRARSVEGARQKAPRAAGLCREGAVTRGPSAPSRRIWLLGQPLGEGAVWIVHVSSERVAVQRRLRILGVPISERGRAKPAFELPIEVLLASIAHQHRHSLNLDAIANENGSVIESDVRQPLTHWNADLSPEHGTEMGALPMEVAGERVQSDRFRVRLFDAIHHVANVHLRS
jgi:hypothetical protein